MECRTSLLCSLLKIHFFDLYVCGDLPSDVSNMGKIKIFGVMQISATKLCGDDINHKLHHNHLAVLFQNLIHKVHDLYLQFDTKFMVICLNLADLIFDRKEVVLG
jgi:hypothetical protein